MKICHTADSNAALFSSLPGATDIGEVLMLRSFNTHQILETQRRDVHPMDQWTDLRRSRAGCSLETICGHPSQHEATCPVRWAVENWRTAARTGRIMAPQPAPTITKASAVPSRR